MLLMTPKPTIAQVRRKRKFFSIKNIIYHQLERKGHEIFIEKEEYRQRVR